MTELGQTFEASASGPKGPDLYVSVRPPLPVDGVPTRVRVPLELPHAGALVRRADPHGDGDELALGIPPGLAAGTTLRLRGAGGVCSEPGGSAGDLYVTIEGFEESLGLLAPAARVALPGVSALLPAALVVAALLAVWLLLR